MKNRKPLRNDSPAPWCSRMVEDAGGFVLDTSDPDTIASLQGQKWFETFMQVQFEAEMEREREHYIAERERETAHEQA